MLVGISAAAQTGTNSGTSQDFQKPRTGRNDQVITSPDINAAITGTTGSTTGQPADVAGGTNAVAGAGSAASLTTAEVTTRETMERQRLMQLIGKTGAAGSPQTPSPPFIASSSGGKAFNGHNEAEQSRLAGLQQGPPTDNGPKWSGAPAQAQANAQSAAPQAQSQPRTQQGSQKPRQP
ncbi:MAG TPA: hypothetical protein VE998_05615 [Terriglobales bacterium]|nr:hypothetical protein [Terriglobales bacterium]